MATELPKWRVSKCPSGLSSQRRRAGRTFLPNVNYAYTNANGPSCLVFTVSHLTRFNKICRPTKGPDGKWTRKPLAYRESNTVHLLITRPPDMCQSTLFLNIFTLLAVTQSVDNLFHSFIVLCENECFLMSNLH